MNLSLYFLTLWTLFQTNEFTAQVVGIQDGDTIEILLNNEKTPVRIFGIDSPEDGQAFSGKAKQYLTVLCLNKKVRIIKKKPDKYGRMVGEIILEDGRSAGKELIAAGYTWLYRKFTDDPEMIKLEDEARKHKKGLWIEENPTAPWDYRKSKTVTKQQ